jgi:hypothetical protein
VNTGRWAHAEAFIALALRLTRPRPGARHAKAGTLYSNTESTARAARKGLWSEAVPIAPWDFPKSGGTYSAKESAATCSCTGSSMCLGSKGGSFCIASNGKTHYQKRADPSK